jgi:hypothetical protein
VPITDLLALSIHAVSQPDFRAEPYRKHREAWVLGHFAVIYNTLPGCRHLLESAEAGDSADIPADFAIYDAAAALVADAEIAELTDVWEWWQPGTTIPEVDDPWGNLSRLLRQKGQKAKRYRTPTWLIIYDNVSSGIFGELNGRSFGAADVARLTVTTEWLAPSTVTEIWMLSSDGTRATLLWRRPDRGQSREERMGTLKVGMTHDEAAAHLRQEVIGTLRYETGPLVDGAKFFGGVRAIMCDIDYVAALFEGWDGQDPRRIATAEKFRRFVELVFPTATGDQGYRTFAGHLYAMYRVGTVHLRHPKQLENAGASTPVLSWGVMVERTEDFDYPAGSTTFTGNHLRPVKVDIGKTILPVSLKALLEDSVAACEHFARLLEAEKAAGGHALLDKWRQVADALVTPDKTKLGW